LGTVHGDNFVTLIILLEEESNGDTVRQMEKRRSRGEFPVVFIETDVAEFEEFRTRSPETEEYSQERMAKKNAPTTSWPIARSSGVSVAAAMARITRGETAF
jgi:hypothetical protein